MTNKREENKRENRKALKKFILIILAGGVFGGFLGGFGFVMEERIMDVCYWLEGMLPEIAFIALLVTAGIFHLATFIFYRQSVSLYQQWDGEEEKIAEQIDKKLGYAMWGESINTILNFFFFGMGIGKTELDIPLLVVFILNIVLVVIFQQKSVDLTKVMNPEKHGSVYDRKFLDKWMESCDEAEKMDIYHAAWSSYRVMSVAYVGAWLVTYLAHMFCGMDFFASIVVTVLWLIQSCVYCYKSIYR